MKNEKLKLVAKYCYAHPHPALTVDVVVVTRGARPMVLLIRRKHAPFAGSWAIPGGYVEIDEPLEDAARREMREETGLDVGRLEQLHTFGDPRRDPRERTISVVYLARVEASEVKPHAGDDAAEVGWFNLQEPPELAFDHKEILAHVRRRLKRKSRDSRN
jgi:8-oxo-dGTP diphosphatase